MRTLALAALPLVCIGLQIDDATLRQYNEILEREHKGGPAQRILVSLQYTSASVSAGDPVIDSGFRECLVDDLRQIE